MSWRDGLVKEARRLAHEAAELPTKATLRALARRVEELETENEGLRMQLRVTQHPDYRAQTKRYIELMRQAPCVVCGDPDHPGSVHASEPMPEAKA